MHRFGLIVGTVGALALGACSGDDSAPTTTGAPAPSATVAPTVTRLPAALACSLASADEVTKVTGVEALTPAESAGPGFRGCDFTDATKNPVVSLRVVTTSADPPPGAEFAVLAQQAGAEEVPGLGDAALWSNGALHVLAGDEFVSITVDSLTSAGDEAAFKAASVALAAVVVPRFAAQEAAGG